MSHAACLIKLKFALKLSSANFCVADNGPMPINTGVIYTWEGSLMALTLIGKTSLGSLGSLRAGTGRDKSSTESSDTSLSTTW